MWLGQSYHRKNVFFAKMNVKVQQSNQGIATMRNALMDAFKILHDVDDSFIVYKFTQTVFMESDTLTKLGMLPKTQSSMNKFTDGATSYDS